MAGASVDISEGRVNTRNTSSGKVRVQNCTSQVFSLVRNLDLSIHVYGFLQPSQAKPANNYRWQLSVQKDFRKLSRTEVISQAFAYEHVASSLK